MAVAASLCEAQAWDDCKCGWRVSQRRGYSGTHLMAARGRQAEIFIGASNQKKEPPATVRPILFCKQALYGERNSEVERAVRTRGVLRSGERVFRRSATAAANARGNYYDLRARRGKGRAECCDSVYHTDGLPGTDGVSIFR